MQNGSVRNSGASDVLFDVLSGEVCQRAGCQNAVPAAEPGKRGRRSKYCSTACKSKAARDKAKADAARSALEGVRAELLRASEAAVDVALAFLDAVDADPVAAYEQFYTAHAQLGARVCEAARDVRDEIRWPGLSGQALELRRAEEDLTRPDLLARVDPRLLADEPTGPAFSGRSENPAPGVAPTALPISDRSEKVPAPARGTAPAVSDRSEKPLASVPAPAVPAAPTAPAARPAVDAAAQRVQDFEALRRAACTDPVRRFGEPQRVDDLAVTFGPGWALASWNDPQAADVQLLLHHGRPVGWTAPLPDGSWGRAGHIAAQHHDERTATILTHPASSTRTYRSTGDALDALQRAAHTPSPAQAGLPADVPRLALGPALRTTPPTEQGLGEPRRDHVGPALARLTWPGRSTAHALEHNGGLVGWTEPYQGTSDWVTLLRGRPVVDAADSEPLLSANPDDALTLLRLALDQGLAATTAPRPFPPARR
ncbi:hypothetical protein ABZ747_18225 [Kitasatospora cineracea]|uniref:hypothetical protein n=1 Tax=Kitasatospora cineracea TaxID=88074 RepID=UPI0033DEE79B